MPCDSSYMEPSTKELEMSKVATFLDEIKKGVEPAQNNLKGFHPNIYNNNLSDSQCDALVAELCKLCQEIDVTTYSLELQIWWRDHQAADMKRKQL